MIRCTKCGQSKEFSLKNSMDETIVFVLDDMGTKVVGSKIDDVALGQDMNEAVEAAIIAASDLEVTCVKCNEENHIVDARTAFEDPLEYFETENLCHCGKELWMDQIPGTRTYAFICDDEECGWIKPTGAVSGA